MNTETKAQPKKKGRVGEVRCLNCFTRFRPPLGVERATCPECNFEWYISWKGTLAKIRKPVWDNWEQRITRAQEAKE